MESFRLMRWGSPAERQDVPQPDPGPGQVLVRIGGAGLCHSDLHLMDEFTDGMVPWGPPFTLGHENAGWVEQLGAGVHGLEVGEPVAIYGPWGCGRCSRCVVGAENYCERQATLHGAGGGLGFDGGLASHMLVPHARWLVPIGELDPVLAAPLTDAGLTPYHAIKRSHRLLTPGSNTVVIGAGGLGHMAIQILRELTATRIIVVDQRPDALGLATTLGADAVVVAGDDAAAAVMDTTNGLGVDLTLDLVGADSTLALAAAVTRSLGHLTIVGIGGGTLSVGFFALPYEVSVSTTYWGTIPELMEVVALAEEGRIMPDVHRFGFDQVDDAYASLRAGTVEGRAVVVPDH